MCQCKAMNKPALTLTYKRTERDKMSFRTAIYSAGHDQNRIDKFKTA